MLRLILLLMLIVVLFFQEDTRARGFERNLTPDKIIGVTDEGENGDLLFLMTWLVNYN